MHDILLSMSARILMNAWFFCTTIFNLYWTTIFKVFYFLFPSCIIPRAQLKSNWRKKIQESKYSSTTKISFKQLISIDQNKFCWYWQYQVCFQKNVFNVLKYVFKDFGLGKTFQLLKLSFTYSVKDLMVYDYFSRNYGHFVNHDWQRFFLPRIWKNANKVLG